MSALVEMVREDIPAQTGDGLGLLTAVGSGGSGDTPTLPTDYNGDDSPEDFYLGDIHEDHYFAGGLTGRLALKLDSLRDRFPGMDEWPSVERQPVAPIIAPEEFMVRASIERLLGMRHITQNYSQQ